MSVFDEIKQYLPKYLSVEATSQLFQNLNDFPDNLNEILYTNRLTEESEVFQGDGLRDMLITNLPDTRIEEGPVVVISNTCDTSFSNKREIPLNIIYCPIVRLSKYIDAYKNAGVSEARIAAHIADVRKQRITHLFYLPQGGALPSECIALFDRINNCAMSFLTPERVIGSRLFTLSNYGFYLFLFKLSIHFTRIRETVARD
jgi:hypothetical protein